MPVTRSEGRGRKPSNTQPAPSSPAETTETSATGTSTEATTTQTGTTATEDSEETTASGTTDPTTVTSAASVSTAAAATAAAAVPPAPAATAPPAAAAKLPSVATTLTASKQLMKPPAAATSKSRREGDASTVKRIVKNTAENKKPADPPLPRPPSKKGGEGGSTYSKSKKISKAKEELLRLQVELAAARLAALEAEDTEEEDEEEEQDSLYSEVNARVDNWLDNQVARPVLAIANEPHCPPPQPTVVRDVPPQPEETHRVPAGGQTDLTLLAEAITKAVKAAQRPKFIELPIFSGSHQEWLPFRAAYYESESTFSIVENINRLRRNLKGKAREAVEGLLITNTHPSEVMKTLESRFGRPESIAMLEMETLRSLPRLSESPRDICIFATKISNVVATLKTLGCYNYMHSPELAKTLVDKLTPTLRYRYYDFSSTQPKEDPCLIKLERYLKREAELCGPYALPEQVAALSTTAPTKKTQRVTNVTEKRYTPKCFACDETNHTNITECETFKKMETDSRWDTAKSKRLCFRCLRYRNKTHHCRAQPCGVNGCKYTHNKLLHQDKKSEQAEKTENTENESKTESINSAWTVRKQSYLKILPVQVNGPKGSVNTFALMDDGSTVTLVDDDVAASVGATGPSDPLKLETINEMKAAESASRRVTIGLKGKNKCEETVQARTIRNLQVSSQRVPQELVERCPHLSDIKDHLAYANAKPRILIGQDNWHLLITEETRRGDKNHPVASLTPLGWVLHGSQTTTLGRKIDFVSHVTEAEDDLESLVKRYFEVDALCINPKRPKSDPEEKALQILEQKTEKVNDTRYQTGLLWKKENITLPDNYENSLKRLYNIEKKIDRDPALKKKYVEQMEALIEKGYAEPAPREKTPDKTWYLPHFAVINPMKPDKLRVVHDAAAKTRGVALNDMLLKGPDLLQSLPGVVMRFRQHLIGVTADIKEMFMQVKLRAEDRDALRYLWRGERRDDKPPEEYRMTSLIFGASSSPATAIYVKNLNAKQHEVTHPEAAAAIVNKHYVDDYLDSFRSLEDAIRISTSVREVHKKASFELKQWKSNSAPLLEALGEETQTGNLELYKTKEQTERVLGVIWRMKSDELTFNLNMARIPTALVEGKRPTKREALRIVMSLFDPLGFASPVTIRAKQLLQEVWRRGTAWDDYIDQDLAEQWESWMGQLKSLHDVTIPRRYLKYSDASTLELHVFSDASESAYTAVLYWRAVTSDEEIGVSLIMAKAKVAPLKLTSIPRLELQAAVMGTRLADAVIEEHEKKPDRKVFWTDSRTVLTWIRTGSRSYKPYVAHRLAAIEDSTKVNDWRWIPTKQNVADDATRDVPAAFDKNHRWYKGPDFLYLPEDSWPTEPAPPTTLEENCEERTHHISNKRKHRLAESLPDPTKFSNWDRLRYATARVLQFIDLCKTTTQKVNYRRTKKNKEADPAWKRTRTATEKQQAPRPKKQSTLDLRPVTADLLIRAEELLMRSTQEETFTEEIDCLNSGKSIAKESRLHQLSVECVNGSLRLRSRIRAAENIKENVKSPLVVSGEHPTVKLWIKAVHRQLHHAGVEATINECRQQYWVLRLRPITRTVIKQCLFCRMKTQTPPYPRTGDLPACRLAHHKRPFTFTGVDYFGPLSVTVGRARQKRYVAIFTCLTTRAIHLEVAGSLSADSAVMAVRRMIARRGCPTEIWSDNGTNLKAADKELRQTIDAATAEEAAKKTISWRYIPPGAPFMGGAWERMVRSVKNALAATLHERHPTEEVLATLLAEVEYTVNSRPLTHVSVNAEDPEALTPNHFLLGGPGRVPQPGTFTERDAASRSSWRAAQRLADIFWLRWVKEYLPELQHRREPHGRGQEVKVNDLVQIVDPNLPRNVWLRGRVVATYPGPDDVVRTVDVQTKGGVLRRPVRKLVILPLSTDDAPAPE